MSQDKQRQVQQPAFVLHSYPYRETSLLVEVFSRRHGRLVVVARGARRPRSAMRGSLLAFQPLLLAWSGRGEVRSLHGVEWQGGQPLLSGDALLCGFYLNELMIKLLPREDAHEKLYDNYQEALKRLAMEADSAPVLRSFEKQMLKELGYALDLERESVTGASVEADRLYTYEPDRGVLEMNGARRHEADGPVMPGGALLAMSRDDYRDASVQQHSKALMRTLINHRLGRQSLNSRQIFRDLQEL
ncbi:MAG: DNA repair protein RecO [Betaproteobacteria bacterium]|nr:DNA repair protein RecO [Pseudomonadota bacterium]